MNHPSALHSLDGSSPYWLQISVEKSFSQPVVSTYESYWFKRQPPGHLWVSYVVMPQEAA